MNQIKVGQYIYKLHGSQFCIYQCDYNDGIYCSYTPVMSEPLFNDPKLARRRVYELNGWNYKPLKNNTVK